MSFEFWVWAQRGMWQADYVRVARPGAVSVATCACIRWHRLVLLWRRRSRGQEGSKAECGGGVLGDSQVERLRRCNDVLASN